jgi:Radical SAM superfamily
MQNEKLKVALIHMASDNSLSLHEPIGIEVLASSIMRKFPNAELLMYDTQPERVRNGKIDIGGLAETVRKFGSNREVPMLLGISVPIYAYDNTKSLLLELEARPPVSLTSMVLGNTIPTYADSGLILKDFPCITLVRGEGDEAIVEIAQRVATYNPVERIYEQKPDLKSYEIPFREKTIGSIMALGGAISVEGSRGCGYGHCTFCPRLGKGGKDYRIVPEGKVVATIKELAEKYNVTKFGFTDEEAFMDVNATRRLIDALSKENLPKLSFRASLRVDEFNRLEEEGIIRPLMDVGLDTVFIGVEGGSNRYLRLMSKGITVEAARKAIDTAKAHNLGYEIGFIMFSWRMTSDMLKENINFAKERDNFMHISDLLRGLDVRAGSIDETILKQHMRVGKLDYDMGAGFSINDLKYKGIPFLDRRVGRVYQVAQEYEAAEANLYYALKSYERNGQKNGGDVAFAKTKGVDDFRRELVKLRLELLQHAAGIDENAGHEGILGIFNRRRSLVKELYETMEKSQAGIAIEDIKREARVFLENEPKGGRYGGNF